MNTILIRSQKDLYRLKEVSQVYDEVIIKLTKLKFQGLIRHAVKYGMFALKLNGQLTIKCSPFVSYHLRSGAIDFWQVKYEVFNCLRDTVAIAELNPEKGQIVLTKKKHEYNYSGISFGIVFSGNKAEEQQLINSISSIRDNRNVSNIPFEILISGPIEYDPGTIINNFIGLDIKYLPLEISTKPRLMICQKKNYLFEVSRFSLVVIIHTRILFSKYFIDAISKSLVEMVTPAVYFKRNGKQLKYLDIGFLNSYQSIQFGAKSRTVAGENITEDYFHWFKNRVPYIDGGLNVFNKNIITEPPYNPYIAWGEAEDIDVCNRLFQRGILIDYLPCIKCTSASNKLVRDSVLKKIARKVFVYINKNFA